MSAFSKKTKSLITVRKILNFTTIVLISNLLLYLAFRIVELFFDTRPHGDEGHYLNDLIEANQFGLAKAISEGASITFLFFSFYLDKIINEPLITLKVISFICGIFIISSLYYFCKIALKFESPIKNQLFLWIIYLFAIQSYIFIGINDVLLDLFGLFLFISFYLKFNKSHIRIILFGLFLALMLATRKMAATYIFIFFLIFILFSIISKHSFFNFKNTVLIIFCFSAFFIAFNFYNLIHYHEFSFDDKNLNGSINWAQWEYHNALLIDKGIQERFHHVDINQTKKYLEENGKNSLPSNFFEMITANPTLTIKEFFVDFAIGLKYFFRQIGILILPFILFLILRIKKFLKGNISVTDFVYLFSALYFISICFIVITNIQSRWFMVFVPIMVLLIGRDLNYFKEREQMIFSICNNILLVIMCLPYFLNKFRSFL